MVAPRGFGNCRGNNSRGPLQTVEPGAVGLPGSGGPCARVFARDSGTRPRRRPDTGWRSRRGRARALTSETRGGRAGAPPPEGDRLRDASREAATGARRRQGRRPARGGGAGSGVRSRAGARRRCDPRRPLRRGPHAPLACLADPRGRSIAGPEPGSTPDAGTAREPPAGKAAAGPLGVASRRGRAPGAGRLTQPAVPAADWLRRLRGARKRLRPPGRSSSCRRRPVSTGSRRDRSGAAGPAQRGRPERGRRTEDTLVSSLPTAPGFPEASQSPRGGAAAGTPRPRPGKTPPAAPRAGRDPPPARPGPGGMEGPCS